MRLALVLALAMIVLVLWALVDWEVEGRHVESVYCWVFLCGGHGHDDDEASPSSIMCQSYACGGGGLVIIVHVAYLRFLVLGNLQSNIASRSKAIHTQGHVVVVHQGCSTLSVHCPTAAAAPALLTSKSIDFHVSGTDTRNAFADLLELLD